MAQSHLAETLPQAGGDARQNAEAKRLGVAFDIWRARLLDLTKRNRALNFRPTKVSTITVIDEKPAEVFRLLVGESRAFTFRPMLASRQAGTGTPAATSVTEGTLSAAVQGEEGALPFVPYGSYQRHDLAERHTDTVLQCQATPEALDVGLRRLDELHRTSLEEQGVNTLFLALGFLKYKEISTADTFLRAPLILVPVRLERTGARTGFRLLATDEEPLVNPSLVEYLKRIHRIMQFPVLPEPGDGDGSIDLLPFFEDVQRAVSGQVGWEVTEAIVLATFTFQKLVIFKDLEANQPTFRDHPLVRRVVLKEGIVERDLPEEIRNLDLDRDYPAETKDLVVDADSSQLRAIAAVERKHDLVIHGPPGTGKSQTITNIIASALGAGKRVLFVSEKMAALDVVHRRLAEAKLGEFCLELHSNKASKAVVIDGLRHALVASGSAGAGAPSSGRAVADARSQLNEYAAALHARRTELRCSVYEAVGHYAAAFTARRVSYPGDPGQLTREQLDALEQRIRQAEATGREVDPVARNGWRESALQQVSEDLLTDIADTADEARAAAEVFQTEAGQFLSEFGLRGPSTVEEVESRASAADHLATAPGLPPTVLRDPQWATPPAVAVDLIELGRRTAALGKRLAAHYEMDALAALDLSTIPYIEEKLGGVFGFLAILNGRYRQIRRDWHGVLRPNVRVSILEQAAEFKSYQRWVADRASLNANPNGRAWFGKWWNGADSDWGKLASLVTWLQEFHRVVEELGPLSDRAYELGEKGGTGHSLPSAIRGTAKDLSQALGTLVRLVEWPAELFAARPVADIRARVVELQRDHPLGATWAAFVRAIRALDSTPVSPMAMLAYRGVLPPAELGRAFRRSLYASWLERVVPTEKVLADFSTAAHEDVRHRFRQLDEQLLTETQQRVVERLRGMSQSRYGSANNDHRAFLTREMARQRAHKPLRVTLREAGEAVAALKPCFLMSPLSVSQYLSPGVTFDLVVFDEASQLPTEDAIAAICRGKQLVVVGDPKQLPPTDFFAVQAEAVETELDEHGDPVLHETESVLEEFQAAGVHQAHLEWHYRSAHESLIQFNNEQFYGNRLVVFPSAAADGPELGLQFIHLPEGRYVGAGVNPVEAERVADEVIAHFRTAPDLTLGVGTFNQRQQMAILDALERRRRADPSLEPCFARDGHEPFFVKNLENIQGDERDVIFLSITYGPRADGTINHNFGPLNREQGGRRLNVLVSRARRRMCVFSSLRAGDIDLARAATAGPRLLRDFLLFAETGRMMQRGTPTGVVDSPFEAEVASALEGLGYVVDPQVGVGSYRIDLGVRLRERPGQYVAGIECDGAAYHSAPCARDRDRLRQAVLERRGWTILRVWSTDWFRDRRGSIERLGAALTDLSGQMLDRRGPVMPTVPGTSTATNTPPAAPQAPARRYCRPQFMPHRKASLASTPPGTLISAPDAQVASVVAQIVAQEGPMHREDVIDRVLAAWGHERRGARLLESVEAGIQKAHRQEKVTSDGAFLSNGGPVVPRDRSEYDVGAERVPLTELATAIRQVLQAGAVMPEVDLLTEVREAMGLVRTNAGEAALSEALQVVIQAGHAVYSPAGLRARG